MLSVIPVSAPGTRLATLHWFSLGGADGWYPNGLALGADGTLYGTTEFGGPRLAGTVFSITTNGAITTLASFMGTNGSRPQAAPVQGADGSFYGTTRDGGANGAGTVFKMTPDGVLTALYSFLSQGEGGYPQAALVQGADGNFYGTTPEFWESTVFRITPAGVFTNLHLFTGETDGSSPNGALLSAADGNLYGVTGEGGTDNDGTVFRITPQGAFATLYMFANDTNGISPAGALVQGTDGNFYGVTRRSTSLGFQAYGTVFRITPDGVLTTLHQFKYTDGAYPAAGLIQGSDGNFYGTTYGDTTPARPTPGPSPGNGTVFRMTPDGTLTTLVKLDGFNTGWHPESALVEGPDGSLYGTTTDTIFRLSFTSAPQITSQPENQTVVAGANVSFSVAVIGASPLFYQWQKNGTNLTDGDDLSGSTARILRLGNLTPANAGTYSVMVSNALGSATSTGALLTVISPPVFQTVRRTNDTVVLTWSAAVGQVYQLQNKSNLSSTSWNNLSSAIAATNASVTASDVIGSDSQRFYRVILVP